ncbi:MAG: hypothetical protein GY906_40005 [bacterium]|nr:hypothetical protein [bacterium]
MASPPTETPDETVVLNNPQAKGPPIFELRAVAERSSKGMVVSSSREASEVGARILESGGNAVDAAVAAALALGVVEPSESGLGGITYLLLHLADGRSVAIDGSGPVPLNIDSERIFEMAENSQNFGIELATVPGTLAALEHAREKYGTRTLPQLLEPAIELADHGYHITAFGQTALMGYYDEVAQSRYLKRIVLIRGIEIPSPDQVITRPLLARTLRLIAARGIDEFYRGSIAKQISRDMKRRGGYLCENDFALFQVRELEPVRGSYRGKEIVSFPSPGSGSGLIHALNILEQLPQATIARDSVDRYELLTKVFKAVHLDHHMYFLEPEGRIPGLTYPSLMMATERASEILNNEPVEAAGKTPAPWHTADSAETTQISVMDRLGNVVSLTQTLGRLYGSKTACPRLGFPYNSLLEGAPELEPMTINPTYMAPSIVLDAGTPYLVLGSAGSSRIPGILAGVISNCIDRKMNLRDAIEAGRIVWGAESPGFHVEIIPPITEDQVTELRRRGFKDVYLARLPTPMGRLARFGAVNAIQAHPKRRTLIGVGDPRRHGCAVGVKKIRR